MSTPPVPPPEFETYPELEFVKNRRFTLDDFKPLFDGKVPLPNFEPRPLWQVAAHLSHFLGILHEGGYAMIRPSRDRSWTRALYMLSAGQSNALDGEGYVITAPGWSNDGSHVIAGHFALCQHEKVARADANPDRGWHPGWCKKCGTDLTVDSSD